jgi:hypothetical protein
MIIFVKNEDKSADLGEMEVLGIERMDWGEVSSYWFRLFRKFAKGTFEVLMLAPLYVLLTNLKIKFDQKKFVIHLQKKQRNLLNFNERVFQLCCLWVKIKSAAKNETNK